MKTGVEAIFRDCFGQSHRTRLEGGAAEPLYQPSAQATELHTIHYREDYFSSALHEVAHWCIAGRDRRRLADYGYWYAPDGRDGRQQRLFEQVEARPQAIEWHFALAAGIPFRVSVDNLDGDAGDAAVFHNRVRTLALEMISEGLPPRAEQFRMALARHYGGTARPQPGHFDAHPDVSQ